MHGVLMPTSIAKDNLVDAEDSAKLLLERDCRPEKPGYTWTHDPKARTRFMTLFGIEICFYMLSSISCPMLVLEGDKGDYAKESVRSALKLLQQNTITEEIKRDIDMAKQNFFKNVPNAEYHMVQGLFSHDLATTCYSLL